jgi:AcrR family transcriptional regulator
MRAGQTERRQAILAVAWRAFLEDGYAATSMSNIAARLGGSKGTLYNYFASKEELFRAVVAEKCNEIQASLLDAKEAAGDLRETMTALGIRFLRAMLSDDFVAFYRLVIAEAARVPEIGLATYETGRREALRRISEQIAGAVKAGLLVPTDPLGAAEFFWDLCASGLHHRKLFGVPPVPTESDIRANVVRAVSLFLSAFGAGARSTTA